MGCASDAQNYVEGLGHTPMLSLAWVILLSKASNCLWSSEGATAVPVAWVSHMVTELVRAREISAAAAVQLLGKLSRHQRSERVGDWRDASRVNPPPRGHARRIWSRAATASRQAVRLKGHRSAHGFQAPSLLHWLRQSRGQHWPVFVGVATRRRRQHRSVARSAGDALLGSFLSRLLASRAAVAGLAVPGRLFAYVAQGRGRLLLLLRVRGVGHVRGANVRRWRLRRPRTLR